MFLCLCVTGRRIRLISTWSISEKNVPPERHKLQEVVITCTTASGRVAIRSSNAISLFNERASALNHRVMRELVPEGKTISFRVLSIDRPQDSVRVICRGTHHVRKSRAEGVILDR